MSTPCDQTYLLPGPVMIIKLSLDEQNLQMPCVHVKQESSKQESRKELKFGGPLRLNRVDLSCMAKSNSYGGVIKSAGHDSQCLHL